MKQELKDTLATVKAAREVMQSAQKAYSMRKDELLRFAPVKVGDTIRVTGYSHRGKNMTVKQVFIKEHSTFRNEAPTLTFKATGPVLKKDGTPATMNVGECEWDMEGNPPR